MPPSQATSTPDRRTGGDGARYTFIGGKGGVGKTTCAAATAVASARRGLRTLVISTDPAPSLGDAFEQDLGAQPRPVRGVRNLHAVEIDAHEALAAWLTPRRPLLESIALRGTWFDREDVSELLRLSLPGIDEIAALLQLGDLGEDPRYDRIIVDTAPTGHLLRMLGMPEVLRRLALVFDRMQAKHRVMVGALRGLWTPDTADALIEDLTRRSAAMEALLRDPARAGVCWLTLPEAMSVEETLDSLRWLRDRRIAVKTLLVNRLTGQPPQACRWCSARRRIEAAALDTLSRTPLLRGVNVTAVPDAPSEPTGVAALTRWDAAVQEVRLRPSRGGARPPARRRALLPAAWTTLQTVPPVATPGTRLLIFGGKGGVGKTTCAAAVAVELATACPELRVLLLSTDPAHSLGDALGHHLSDCSQPVRGAPGNLSVRELNAGEVFSGIRQEFARTVDDLFARVTSEAMDTPHDRQVLRDLLELAPPGVDELAATLEVMDGLLRPGDRASGSVGYDLVVMDTAPTGHALRLLAMPSLVHDWVKAIMGVLLKYRRIVGLGDLGAGLLRLSQGLTRLRELLQDGGRTSFIAVTRPGAVTRAETVRLLEHLRSEGLRAPVLIVNAAGAGSCSRCRTRIATQRRDIVLLQQALRKAFVKAKLVLSQAQLPPPHGAASLREWRATWRLLPAGAPSARGRPRVPRKG